MAAGGWHHRTALGCALWMLSKILSDLSAYVLLPLRIDSVHHSICREPHSAIEADPNAPLPGCPRMMLFIGIPAAEHASLTYCAAIWAHIGHTHD